VNEGSDDAGDPLKRKIVTAVGVAAGRATATARASVRRNIALYHLRAAARAARESREIEKENSTAKFGDWFEELLALVPISIVMAGASQEANVNEIIQDILDVQASGYPSKTRMMLLNDLKHSTAGNSMGRYRGLALLLDRVPDKGTVAWSDAALLVRFRNSLMHFKPEWDDDTAPPSASLAKQLGVRLSPSRFFPKPSEYPYAFMTYECAAWAVETVLAFSGVFSELIGVRDGLGEDNRRRPLLWADVT
jgi:hypothetical protein